MDMGLRLTHAHQISRHFSPYDAGFAFVEFATVAEAERALSEVAAAQGPDGDELLATVAPKGYTPEQKRARQLRQLCVMSRYAGAVVDAAGTQAGPLML